MSYRLKRGETVPDGIRRIVQEEIGSALDALATGGARKREVRIHEGRKSLKRIRGALRLMQPELGRVYRDENGHIREIGCQLSEIRDAAAMIEIFDSLLEKYNGSLQKDAFASIRRALEKNKREIEQAAGIDKVAQRAAAMLRATKRRVNRWPLQTDGFQAIAPGLELRYRRGRKAMIAAQQDPRPETYHEWRKRVKDHWYHVRLLESLWTDVMQAHESSLKNLEGWLGDDHNLVVLCGKLRENPAQYGEPSDVQLFLALAAEHQKELRDNATSLGQRVYERKPRQLIRDFSKLWDAWHEQPDSMKEVQKAQREAAKKQPGRAAPPSAKAAAVA